MAEPWCSQGFMPCSAKGFFESFLQFYKKKKNTARVFFSFGRGIRIRTLNNGVRDAGLLSKTQRFKPNFRVCVSQKSLAYRILNIEKL